MRHDSLRLAENVWLNVLSPETLDEAHTGLLAFESISDTMGMSFKPCPVLHTFGMKFPMDVLWLGDDGELLAYDEMVGPENIVVPKTAWGIEVMGGWVRRNLMGKGR